MLIRCLDFGLVVMMHYLFHDPYILLRSWMSHSHLILCWQDVLGTIGEEIPDTYGGA